MLNSSEKVRYARHLILPAVGEAGQLRLKQAKVLFVGTGGLGSAPAMYLAAAGVGTIGLMDADIVSESNLQRQILFNTADVNRLKVEAARDRLNGLNPHIKVMCHPERLTAKNAAEVFENYDIIVDGTDNLPARYLINDAAFFLKKTWIYGGVHQFEGQCSVFAPEGPCYRCFFRDPPPPDDMPSCADAGVIGVIPGMIGIFQANEVIKLICGIGESLKGHLLLVDALSTETRRIRIKQDASCPLCGNKPTITQLTEYEWKCTQDTEVPLIDTAELRRVLSSGEKFFLVDVRKKVEWDAGHIEQAHLISLDEITDRVSEIPRSIPIYCYCQKGGRSAKAVHFLLQQGFPSVFSLSGGYDVWNL